jgi:hypothetical protein
MTAIIVKQLLVDDDVDDAVVRDIAVACVCVRITHEKPILPGTVRFYVHIENKSTYREVPTGRLGRKLFQERRGNPVIEVRAGNPAIEVRARDKSYVNITQI